MIHIMAKTSKTLEKLLKEVNIVLPKEISFGEFEEFANYLHENYGYDVGIKCSKRISNQNSLYMELKVNLQPQHEEHENYLKFNYSVAGNTPTLIQAGCMCELSESQQITKLRKEKLYLGNIKEAISKYCSEH